MPGFGGLGMWEILLILVVILVVFGPRRLPELGGALGKGIREFKSSFRDIESEFKKPIDGDRKDLGSGARTAVPPGNKAEAASADKPEAEKVEAEKVEAEKARSDA